MSFTNFEFPNSSYYDSDLRSILEYMKTFETELDEYQDTIDALNKLLDETLPSYEKTMTELSEGLADINEMKSNISSLQTSLSSLQTTVGNNYTTLKELIDKEVTLQANNYNTLYSMINALDTELREVNTSLQSAIQSARDYSDAQLGAAVYDLQRQIDNLNADNLAEIDDIKAQIVELEDYITNLITELASNVLNPINKERMKFDDNNAKVYVDLRDDGMSFGELSARQFTYGGVKNIWREKVWATKGRRYITHSDTWLHGPAGRWTSWSEGMSYVLGVCQGSLSYESAKEKVTVGELNGKGLTFLQFLSYQWN